MYRYQPPKSSVWGHSLRKMKPARERELFQEFLRLAVASYQVGEGSLGITSIGPAQSAQSVSSCVEHFERVLGTPSFNGFFPKLSPESIEACFRELVSNEKWYLDSHALLLQPFSITSWLVDGREVKTRSAIMVYYGSTPTLSTTLVFESLDEFHCVRRTLETLKLCRLNEKHLKAVKR